MDNYFLAKAIAFDIIDNQIAKQEQLTEEELIEIILSHLNKE